jgi:hypothetical protein
MYYQPIIFTDISNMPHSGSPSSALPAAPAHRAAAVLSLRLVIRKSGRVIGRILIVSTAASSGRAPIAAGQRVSISSIITSWRGGHE